MGPRQNNYHHGDLRRMLISTAEEIIFSQGLEALTLRLLSNNIGVSHTAVYRHFKSKHELFCALALEGFTELKERFQEIDPMDRLTPREQIGAMGKAYIEFALENPARFRVMFGQALLGQALPSGLNHAISDAFNSLRKAIERGQAMGAVRHGDPLALTSVGWSMAHGISQLLLDGQLGIINNGQAAPALVAGTEVQAGQDTQRFIDIAVETMTAGLMKQAGDL